MQFLVPIALAIFLVVFTRRRRRTHVGNLPPGPPGDDHAKFLEGHRWNMFKAWNDQYGPVATFFVGPRRHIVLGTMEAAVDLLEKSGEIYSNRPHLLMGVPGRFFIESVRTFHASRLWDELVTKIRILQWPILLWLPRVLQWFRYEPEKQRDVNTKLYMTAMNEEELGFNDLELAYALSAPWAAGIGTTTTALEIAILAMLNFPDCCHKAQAEMDEVVGKGRMPTFEDQQSLPYLDCFIKETLRWRQVTPTGIAHSSTEDYTYRGMLIPTDTTVYANASAIMMDPEVFPEGEMFKPERFMNTKDPRFLSHRYGCFGFGRRICPGMHVALQSLYIVIARMLWAYDVLPAIVDGKPFIPDVDDFTTGLVSYPANLKYRLIPRSEKHDYKNDGTKVLLDANENCFGPSLSAADATAAAGAKAIGIDPFTLNRYPDPHQHALKQRLCDLRNANSHSYHSLTPENVFIGVSSDEPIDALMRCFCAPGRDAILICPPTYGMYAIFAQVNDVTTVDVPLRPAPEFQLNVAAVSAALSDNPQIKLIYLASPGNPTGSLLARSDIQLLLAHPTWNGVVVVDEAYIDYVPGGASLAPLVTEYPNLAVVHTFSKAFGMAAIRIGAAFTSAPIATLLNSLKAPYNISGPSSALASYCIGDKGVSVMREHCQRMMTQRNRLQEELPKISGVGRMRGGTDANFLLYEMLDTEGTPNNDVALAVFKKLAGIKGVVVRFRGKEHGCMGCLRFTVGTEEDVTRLMGSLREVLVEVRGP
ncbi:hypothetical protein NUW58_g4987 [Xylaria curta]|uniref:Uncharacterized protein n=1 Tax=Xylaria curta TaxID=42375 RepID=A0ACC1P6K2_9PEZI|nr:hypothetical protein NUW58_g4987 [Xylaria curta]